MKIKLVNSNITEDYGAQLLRERGVTDINKFLNPDESTLTSWQLLNDIYQGIYAIRAALDSNKPIALVVDCDVDGFTSSAIMYQYIKLLKPTQEIEYYLHDGKQHGLEDQWKKLAEKEYGLIIIPDAASNDSNYAQELAPTPILVLDHHLVEDTHFAKNMIVINNQLSPLYFNKDLSGAGVVFQFCRALDEAFNCNHAFDFIDLAAVGVCGDMMSGLEIENQYIWKLGFSKLNNYFLKCLYEKQAYSMNNRINPMSVAFYMVPLINAMIRIGTPEEKRRTFQAMIDGHALVPSQKRGEKGQMTEVALEAVRECTNAKTHQDKIKEEAVARLDFKIRKNELLDNKILVIVLDETDKLPSDLTGLVAMQCCAKYNKPTIVGRVNAEGYLRGSIRGINNSALESFKNFLDQTGLCEYVQGHDNAAGISIKETNIPRLIDQANELLKSFDFNENYYSVNFSRSAYDNDIGNIITDLNKYKNIWSQNCSEPLVYIHDLIVNTSEIQVMGRNSDTLKFEKNGITYIKFFAKDLIQALKQRSQVQFELVCKTSLNEWMGRTTPQLQIEAYEISDISLTDF